MLEVRAEGEMARGEASREIEELSRGNMRFAGGWPTHPHQTRERRLEFAPGQRPFAAILSCSDSRVPPEIVFDQGLGDLFVVRTAGHTLDSAVLGSLEYAAVHLEVPLVVVLGHTGCGAVAAAVEGGEHHGHLGHLVEAIRPAVEKAGKEPGNLLDRAVRENVIRVVGELQGSRPILAPLVQDEALLIVGAVYSLETGRVEFLE
jgi:carbonic anhydrase